eukprot:CAMPEP_0194530300 /NCGR_PEP_ID=MMETSP0253-20130528/67220_1 /TAXON_ID=2966 /ORGANISM="Noctiluca scintillans" /LENGTH=198 /DNA_ID=CAMNT_0039375519 /DNA_START=20 /DNA_END=613 /DNA_ORIENTATION=-
MAKYAAVAGGEDDAEDSLLNDNDEHERPQRRWWTPWQNIRGAGAQKAVAAPTYQEDDDENPDIEIDEDGVRMWLANAAEPQDLTFDVPRDWTHGDPVTIQGPHGPLQVPLPHNTRRGDKVTVPLGPSITYTVNVPDAIEDGGVVPFRTDDGQTWEVPVPPGKRPGDTFEVYPPAIMVEVPRGANPGDRVAFRTLDRGR